MEWHGLPMAAISLLVVAIRMYTCGRRWRGEMPLPIMVMLMKCMQWPGHPMDNVLLPLAATGQARSGRPSEARPHLHYFPLRYPCKGLSRVLLQNLLLYK